jgi:uncharacterized protein (TIGR03435 family)
MQSKLLATFVGVISVIGTAWAMQSSAGKPPAFDAASIKENKSLAPATTTLPQSGGHVVITAHTLRMLVGVAFNLDLNQARSHIIGLPGWSDSDRFDVQAEAPGNPTLAQKRLMLQSLLADRFKMTVHRERRTLPVFALVTVNARRLGPQLRRHTDDTVCGQSVTAAGADRESGTNTAGARGPAQAAAFALRQTPCGVVTGGLLQGQRDQAWAGGARVTMEAIAASLGRMTPLERPVVIDRTGLTGAFDFTMEWNPQIQDLAPTPTDVAGLSFLQALREHVGLKLDPQTGPVDVIVVDQVDRPAPD